MNKSFIKVCINKYKSSLTLSTVLKIQADDLSELAVFQVLIYPINIFASKSKPYNTLVLYSTEK